MGESADVARYQQYFNHFAVDGLLNKDGFRSVLQCLEMDPPQCIVDEMFAEHDKDESSQLNQDEFYEWIKDRVRSKTEMRDSLMQSLNILFPESEKVKIDDLLAKLSELGEQFDETEESYARMTLEEFDSNNDGCIDKTEIMNCFYSNDAASQVQVADSNQAIVEDPETEDAKEEPAETDGNQATEEETQETTDESGNQATEETPQETADESGNQATEETQKTADESGNQATEETADESGNHATEETADESGNQATEETADESGNQATEETQETADESGNQATEETADESGNQATEETQETADESGNQATEETQDENQATEETQETADESGNQATEETQQTADESGNQATEETADESGNQATEETQENSGNQEGGE